MSSNLSTLVSSVLGEERASWLLHAMNVDARLLRSGAAVGQAELAQALNMALFSDLLERVPEGAAYVDDAVRIGRKIIFDHGALRTVLADHVSLPAGHLAFDRILKPLGFVIGGLYPLPRLRMTGHVYTHGELAAEIAQFFVSELHVDQFSPAFQQVVRRVVGTSRDPLTDESKAFLAKLSEQKVLTLGEAGALLPNLVACFARQHGVVSRADYEALLGESVEMAWISTEGNAYNHVTDRVADVFALTREQQALGRSIKESVEVSANGRVRQTAFRAAQVERQMVDGEGRLATHVVPGSFYEFISRDRYRDEASGTWMLDLTFDSSNATGIFKMTESAAGSPG
jgi:hypothetical protein